MPSDVVHTEPVDWPRIGWEERPWVSTIPADLTPRAARSRHTGAYRAALVPPIARATPRSTSAASALDAEATAAISRFDAQMGAELAPFEALLLRSESASSSRIENLTAGARAVALAELGHRGTRNATAIVGNVAAMTAALDLSDRLDSGAILAMHGALLARQYPDIAGRWREEQVWIGGDSYGPHGATFVPPHHERIVGSIDDLVRFIQRTDLPLLTQAALAHAQFETIHPFSDGNGRTGRALIHAMLRGHGLTRHVTVPVSAGLLSDTAAYFDTLTAYRDGDPEPVITVLAHSALAAIRNARQLIDELRLIRRGWNGAIKARRGATAWRLADLVLRQPVIDAPTVGRQLGVAPDNALRPIHTLVDSGILREVTGYSRNRIWQSRDVLVALDAFAARAGRRAPG